MGLSTPPRGPGGSGSDDKHATPASPNQVHREPPDDQRRRRCTSINRNLVSSASNSPKPWTPWAPLRSRCIPLYTPSPPASRLRAEQSRRSIAGPRAEYRPRGPVHVKCTRSVQTQPRLPPCMCEDRDGSCSAWLAGRRWVAAAGQRPTPGDVNAETDTPPFLSCSPVLKRALRPAVSSVDLLLIILCPVSSLLSVFIPGVC